MNKGKWLTAAFVVGMWFPPANAHAERITLEHQTKNFRCTYKATVAANLVDIYATSTANGFPRPNVQVRFDAESTQAEQELVAEYMQYAWNLAQTGIKSADAFRETLAACMSEMSVGWDPRKCKSLSNDAVDLTACKYLESNGNTRGRHTDQSFIRVQENTYTLPELPALDYRDEWCWNRVSDAKLIATALKSNVSPDMIHANIEQVDYFSPQRKRSAHALVVDAALHARAGDMGPQAWVQSIIDACLAVSE